MTLRESTERIQRHHIVVALKQYNWNRSYAAIALGVHRNTLMRMIKKLGIDAQPCQSHKLPESVPAMESRA